MEVVDVARKILTALSTVIVLFIVLFSLSWRLNGDPSDPLGQQVAYLQWIQQWTARAQQSLAASLQNGTDLQPDSTQNETSTVSSLHEAFPCRWVPPSIALPFQWFCHRSGTGVTVVGPDGEISLRNFGRVFREGPFVYSFPVTSNNNQTRILYEGKEEYEFSPKRDDCNCPKPFKEFQQAYSCSAEDQARVEALFHWWLPGSVTRHVFSETVKAMKTVPVFGHFAIIKNKVYMRPIGGGEMATWKIYLPPFLNLLKSVLRKVEVPDVEFYYHTHSNPVFHRDQPGAFLFSNHMDPLHRDVGVPSGKHITEAFYGSALQAACQAPPWEERVPKAYFRGSNNGYLNVQTKDEIFLQPRFHAALLAKEHPDLLDIRVRATSSAKLSKEVAAWAIAEELATMESAPRNESLLYRYVLVLDGYGAPFRTSLLLASGSLLVKQLSPIREYFYDAMVPGVHYVPVEESLDNLVKTVQWARDHNDEALAITQKGIRFYFERLRQEDIHCWLATALHKVGEGLAFKPEIAADMTEIENGPREGCAC